MGRYLIPGHEYVDGDTISGASMTEHVSDAILKPTAISEQVLKDPATLTDELLINDNNTLKKVTVAQLRAIIISGISPIPIGAIMDFAGIDAPDGFLLCYGQEVLRETYDLLYAVIGVTYGTGNGTTTFNLPDLRGVVVAGKDDMGGTTASRLSDSGLVGHGLTGTTLGEVGGTQSHTLTTAELASHSHVGADHTHNLTAVFPSFTGSSRGGTGTFSINSETHTTGGSNNALTTSATGSNSRHNNVQPTIILNKIIRYL